VNAASGRLSSATTASSGSGLLNHAVQAHAALCMTQLESQRPSSADCIRSFGFLSVDVNVRSSRCFTVVARRLTPGAAASRIPSAKQLAALAFDYEASVAGPVAVNGIPLPLSGSFTSHYDAGEEKLGLGSPNISFELAGRTVSLGRLDLNIKLEPHLVHGQWVSQLGAVNLGGLGRIGGLGGTGQASLEFVEGSTQLNFGLQLPRVFSMPDGKPASASIQASASNTRPFHIGHFSLNLPYVDLGPVVGKNLSLEYDENSDTWAGGATFLLPGGEPPLELDASPRPNTDYGVQFTNGALRHAGAEVDFGDLAPEIFPGVFLSNLRFTIGTNPIRVFGGGTVNTAKIVYVDGDILAIYPESGETYTVPEGLPGFQRLAGRVVDSPSLAAGGDVYFHVAGLDLPLGNAFFMYTFPARVEFAGGVDVPLGVFHATGEVSGFADAVSHTFSTEGRGRFCVAALDACLGAEMLVSSDGIAGCGSLEFLFFSVNAGAGYHWGGSFHLYFDDCDVGPYRVYANSAKAAASGAGSSFRLPPGLPVADIEVKGVGGAPDVTLHGPHGETLSTSARTEGKEGQLEFFRVDGEKTAYIGVLKPSGGTWTVTANPGSSAITGTSVANGLPAPSVRASVTGSGATRSLHYAVAPREGEKVIFAETGPTTYRRIGLARGSHGTLRFRPAFGLAGTRRLTALVQEGGVTVHTLKLGSYDAPGWSNPTRPRHLKVTRKAGTLRIRWARQPGVHHYLVEVRTADGLPRLVVVKTATATVKGIGLALRGTVTVAGVGADGRHGPAGSVGFKSSRP
jgi:hypothetical protein